MSNLALKASRADYFNVRYNDANVTVRVITDPKSDLFDERAMRPVDAELVQSIKTKGQNIPATGYKEPGLIDGKQVVTIVTGRGRWAAINEAWKQLLAEGVPADELPPFKLIVKRYASDLEKFEEAIIENAHRLQDTPIATARKLVRYFNFIGETPETKEKARLLFNFKSQTALDNTLKLLNLAPEIQQKVVSGEMTPSAGLQLSHLNVEQQKAAVAQIPNIKQATVVDVRAAARVAAGKKVTPKVKSRTEILDRITEIRQQIAATKSESKQALLMERIEALKWAIGERE